MTDRPAHRWRRSLPPLGAVGVAILALAVACRTPGRHPDWASVEQAIDRRFPTVPSLRTPELAAWLADPQRRPPLLIDARAADEYAVSHLPGARLAPTPEIAAALLSSIGDGREVVVYCSVGWRSAQLVQALRARGHQQGIWNLRGSIFAWANEGRPLVDAAGRPAGRVHPYDRRWGRLLAARHRAPLP